MNYDFKTEEIKMSDWNKIKKPKELICFKVENQVLEVELPFRTGLDAD